MGKRKKSSRGPGKRTKQTLDTTFSCLFCNHENSVICSMDKKAGVGNLSCKVCGQKFQATINALSDPVDVYSDWIDACEAVQVKAPEKSTGGGGSGEGGGAAASTTTTAADDDLSDFEE